MDLVLERGSIFAADNFIQKIEYKGIATRHYLESAFGFGEFIYFFVRNYRVKLHNILHRTNKSKKIINGNTPINLIECPNFV